MLNADSSNPVDETERNMLNVVDFAADELNKDVFRWTWIVVTRVYDTTAVWRDDEGVLWTRAIKLEPAKRQVTSARLRMLTLSKPVKTIKRLLTVAFISSHSAT